MCSQVPNTGKTIYTCIICLEKYNDSGKSLSIKTIRCNHTVCPTCIRRYLNETLEKSTYRSTNPILCPNTTCKESFESTDNLLKKYFTDDEVVIWWSQAIIKTFISNKIYCPMQGCGAVFDAEKALLVHCTFSECYECHKGFCMTCQTPWHPEVTVTHVLRDDREDEIKALALAKTNRWTRCPNCTHMVAITDGCNNVQCICGRSFCYGCGRGREICIGGCFNLPSEQLNQMRQNMFANPI
ncbi:hypothetical protein BDF21DRAFT_462614 [Thamnidium elegans]|nr:hypothetical protein BDF21DRAFT_462614 [Thamnidium elegans]